MNSVRDGCASVIKGYSYRHYFVLCSSACCCSEPFYSDIFPNFCPLVQDFQLFSSSVPSKCPVFLVPYAPLSVLLPCGWLLNTLTQDIYPCLVSCWMEFPSPNPVSSPAALMTSLAVRKQIRTYSQVMDPLDHGSPTPGDLLGTLLGTWPHRRWAAGERASKASSASRHRSHYHLNHSPHPPINGKIVFHETGPWCQKGWGPLL